MMKKASMLVVALTLFTVGAVNAQDGKAKKKVAVTEAKAAVAADKQELKTLKADRKDDKMVGNAEDLKVDRKKTRQADKKMVKDQVKKDAAVVKQKL